MFHSDKPIDKKEYDCLNRTEFSKQLAKAILEYTRTDNFTISLCGKWGSGKISILNKNNENCARVFVEQFITAYNLIADKQGYDYMMGITK